MDRELTYIERNMKKLMSSFPAYYEHILSGEELFEFIRALIEKHSSNIDRHAISKESDELISGDFFHEHKEDIISGKLSEEEVRNYRDSFSNQTEKSFLNSDFDISHSRMIRYMPAQWHSSSYFFVYFIRHGNCDIVFSDETVTLKKGDIMILAPDVLHATPCYRDDALLEYFLVRSSSFEKVFWDQLNKDSIMSHFFRNALLSGRDNTTSYLLFETGYDETIFSLIERICEELKNKLAYSSQVINSLTSLLFSLTLRKCEDSVILSSNESGKWKKEYSLIFTYIQDNFANASLQDVADHSGYSPKQVGRIISNYFNMSFTQLITFLKMDRAVIYLKEGSLSMEDISEKLGYSDLPSFYRAFKKYYRCSPVAYLKKDE